jgi:hypothetical protein
MLTPSELQHLAALKSALQQERAASKFENMVAALIGRLIGVTVAVAKSAFQHGADAGTGGRQGRHLRVECKKYADGTSLMARIEEKLDRTFLGRDIGNGVGPWV